MSSRQRIAVIGISGSGKTTFARKLADKLNLPLFHADSVEWAPNWQVRDEGEIFDTYRTWIDQPKWVIEGWVDHHRKARLSKADLVVDLDYSRWRCTWRELIRMTQGENRPELPSGCADRLSWKRLMIAFWRKERPIIVEAVKSANIKSYLRLTSPASADAWLNSLC